MKKHSKWPHVFGRCCVNKSCVSRCGSPYLFEELVAKGAGGTKALLLQGHVLLGLRVEGGVLDQTVDKQPQVVLHLDTGHREKRVIRYRLKIIHKINLSNLSSQQAWHHRASNKRQEKGIILIVNNISCHRYYACFGWTESRGQYNRKGQEKKF